MKLQYITTLISLFLLSGCSGTRPALGLKDGKLTPCPNTPNCLNSQIADNEENSVDPILYSSPLTETRNTLLRILESEEGAKVITTEGNYIYVEYTSAVFRFVDDVEFYLVEEKPDKTVIHIRSASRIGYSDLGVNLKRIDRIKSKF